MIKTVESFLGWFSKPSYLRLTGHRIEVIVFLIRLKDEVPQILLGHSTYKNWMPPQEGVDLKESFEEAVIKCLNSECSIDTTKLVDNKELYIRSIRYINTLKLEENRVGERPIADNANEHAIGFVKMKSKAYWSATVRVSDELEELDNLKPNKLELTEVKWCEIDEAISLIKSSNRPEKSDLLVDTLLKVMSDLGFN